ncbi:hypothetical protein [Paraglaciecola sp. L3A3]|uniref:hypothetical protein n=1 Tax=Paraglaciecola sp. L3A3 TaxID=2686358 RepID=UPI00131D2B8F|nr:hypothetical protein [Paraglaciecola sp. L3A3]
MLINTVILLLRDALPIFVLISLLWTQLAFNRVWLPSSILLGLITTVLLVGQLNFIGNWFDGSGTELLMVFMHFTNYCLALYLGYQLVKKQRNKRFLLLTATCMLVLTLASKGANFTVYFSGYFRQIDALQPMLLGLFLGLGICLSLMILIYFVTSWLDSKFNQRVSLLFILIYTIGQFTNSLPLLVQVDVIDGSAVVWNSQNILSNQSEFGQLFNALFGYQATPSFNQLVVYIFTLCIALSMYFFSTKQGRKR